MSWKIGQDSNRFKDIVKGKVKSDLKKYVSSQDLIGQQNGKMIKIPINNIDLPRFTYGGQEGGAGAGSGEIGDGIGDGDPKGKAGNEKGEHQFSVEFTPEELATMLGEELELPNVEPKNKGKVGSSKVKYNSINKQGTEGLRHFRRTYKEALKRSISSGSYDPSNPIVIPIKDDRRYKSPSPVNEPNINAVVIYIMDISGSMDGNAKQIAQSECFWISAWLKSQYKDIDERFISHDTEAAEVDREQFFTISASGGTAISSGYEFAAHMMEEEYPFDQFCVYLIGFSDGDNWGSEDSQKAISILKNRILPNCNMFGYEQISTSGGSGEFYDLLEGYLPNQHNLILNKINDKTEILNSLKVFLGKGK